jgi:hypothetical protein
MSAASPEPATRLSWLQIVALLMVGPLLSSAFGAVTNCVNGAVSPEFFTDVMGYAGDQWRLSVRNGIIKGALFGLAYGTMFVVLILAVSHRRCIWHTAMRYAVLTIFFAVLLWCVGGVFGVGYVWIAKNDAGRMFGHNLMPMDDRLRYAWVRGSIFAVEHGGFIAVTLSIVVYALRRGPPLVTRQNTQSITPASE